jgi:hypothetical protein
VEQEQAEVIAAARERFCYYDGKKYSIGARKRMPDGKMNTYSDSVKGVPGWTPDQPR